MLNQSLWLNTYKTDFFIIPLQENMRAFRLPQGENSDKFCIKFFIGFVSYLFDFEIIENVENKSAWQRTGKKYAIHNHSAFSGENIAPYQYEKQVSNLVTWGCRFRFVDGAVIGDRIQVVYIELGENILQITYMASPQDFDTGYVLLNHIVLNLTPS
jgi:hypothetical protein